MRPGVKGGVHAARDCWHGHRKLYVFPRSQPRWKILRCGAGAICWRATHFSPAYADVTFVPLLAAPPRFLAVLWRTRPISRWSMRFLHGLDRLGPFQGVYLDMHGADGGSKGLDDAEADFFAAVRAVAGREALLSAPATICMGMCLNRSWRELDLLTAYRTAPHTDGEGNAARERFDCWSTAFRAGIRPHTAFCADSCAFFPANKP